MLPMYTYNVELNTRKRLEKCYIETGNRENIQEGRTCGDVDGVAILRSTHDTSKSEGEAAKLEEEKGSLIHIPIRLNNILF